MQFKKDSILNICLKKDDKIRFGDKANANIFKEIFWNLASDLVAKLTPPSNKFGTISVCNYYQSILDLLPNKLNFSNVTEDLVLKLLKDKAAGIDNISGKLFKNGSNILAKPVWKICNLSIKYSVFSTDCQVAKSKPLRKKSSTRLPKNYRSISSLPLISKIIGKGIDDQTQAILDENKIMK